MSTRADGIRSGDDISGGERRSAFAWLAGFGVFSALIQVVYLDTSITLPSGQEILLPVSVLGAVLFNAVLTATALRWTDNVLACLIPLAAWLVGIGLTFIGPEALSTYLTNNKILAISLLCGGLLGGFWPLARRR